MLEPNLQPDLLIVCYDKSISLVKGRKALRIKTYNEEAAENLYDSLQSKNILAKNDGGKEEDDYQIELMKSSEHSSVNISGDLATALQGLNDLSYISEEKEKQLRLLLADIIIASRYGKAAKIQFHRKPIHSLNNGNFHAYGKTQPTLRPDTTAGNGSSKKL